MDLRPYGLNLTWTPETEIRTIDSTLLSPGHIEDTHVFVIANKRFTAKEKINQGSFGVIYKVENRGKLYACKVLRFMGTAMDFQAFLHEVLIHILLLQASLPEKNGPYVPYLYHLAYDKALNKTYIITEWMDKTLRDEIVHHSKSENDRRLPTYLSQLAHILGFFGETLRFNHRDLHSANIMVGKGRVVIIDFGYSCLLWEGVEFKGPSSVYDAARNPCYKEDRDLPFLLMELYMYYDAFISDKLRKLFHASLIARVDPHGVCDLGVLCPEHGVATLEDRYEFLNKPASKIPGGVPHYVEHRLRAFRPDPRQKKQHPQLLPAWMPLSSEVPKKSKYRRLTLRRNRMARTFSEIPEDMVLEKGVVGPLK